MTDSPRNSITNETPLESWKEIAAYIQRDVRTAKRWEMSEGLPVHRHHHLSRSSVYAYPSELEAWRANRKPAAGSTRSTWWRPVPAFASMITLALALMMAGSGPHVGALVQAADGIVTRQVWAGPDAGGESISPDGRYLAFSDYRNRPGDLAVRDLVAGTTRYLTSEASGDSLTGRVVFSPDGQQIGFGWYDSNVLRELRIVNRDGTGGRILRRGDGKMSIGLMDWSADGKSILALRNREANPRNIRERVNEIVLISSSDGSLQVLKTLDWRYGQMVLSPDGRYIAYDFPAKATPSTNDILLLSSDGSNESVLVEHPAFDYVVDWSPDGKSLFFVSDRTGDWALWRVLVAEGRSQGAPELVKRHVGLITGIGVTSSGALYYKLGGQSSDVYAVALDAANGKATGTPRPMIERFMGSNAGPEWSPDGKRLAYTSRRYPPPHTTFLSIRDLETGVERDLRPELTWFRDLQWFPEGRSLLAYGVGPDGTLGYFRIDTQSGAVSLLFEIEFRGMTPYAVLSPDGRQVYYKHLKDEKAPERIVARDLVSGQERVIARAPDNSEFVELAMSPDGKLLAAKLNWRDKAPYELVVAATTGGELKGVTSIPPPHWFQNIVWTPDSRNLLFTKHYWRDKQLDRVELWRVAVESGKEEPLGLALEGIRDLCVHPTGQRVAYTLVKDLTEVWAMENFLPASGEAK